MVVHRRIVAGLDHQEVPRVSNHRVEQVIEGIDALSVVELTTVAVPDYDGGFGLRGASPGRRYSLAVL